MAALPTMPMPFSTIFNAFSRMKAGKSKNAERTAAQIVDRCLCAVAAHPAPVLFNTAGGEDRA